MSSTVNSTTAPINGFFEWFGELGLIFLAGSAGGSDTAV